MKNKTNKNYYLQKETIAKLEQLSKANNFKNPSNYLDDLILKQNSKNQGIGNTEKEMLEYLIQTSTTKESMSHIINQINNWMSTANYNFKKINETIEKFHIEAPDTQGMVQNDFKEAFNKQITKMHNEGIKAKSSLEKAESRLKELESSVEEACFYSGLIDAMKQHGKQLNDEQLTHIEKNFDDNNYGRDIENFLYDINGPIPENNLGHITKYLKTRIRSEAINIKKSRGQK